MRNKRSIRRTSSPRWRVAVGGGTPSARSALGEAIHRAGGVVAVDHPVPGDALEALERLRPDIAVVAPEPAWHGGSVLLRLRDQAFCPIVLLVQGARGRLLDEACEG